MIYLGIGDLLHIAHRVLGEYDVRDAGLLESAGTRPEASALGSDAYATVHDKAAALAHSIARNHALVDGNKRLAFAALLAFYGVNGHRATMTNDEAYGLIMDIAAGRLDDVHHIAAKLRSSFEPSKRSRRRR